MLRLCKALPFAEEPLLLPERCGGGVRGWSVEALLRLCGPRGEALGDEGNRKGQALHALTWTHGGVRFILAHLRHSQLWICPKGPDTPCACASRPYCVAQANPPTLGL